MATVVLLLASLSVLLPQCSIIVMTEVVIVYIRLPLLRLAACHKRLLKARNCAMKV